MDRVNSDWQKVLEYINQQDHYIDELTEALEGEHLCTDGSPVCNIQRSEEPSELNVDNCYVCALIAKHRKEDTDE